MSQSDPMAPANSPGRKFDILRNFHATLTLHRAGTPEHDYKAICDAWLEVSRASTAMLWLCRDCPEGREWYVVAFASRGGVQTVPPKAFFHESHERGAMEFCAATRRTLFVEMPDQWEEDLNGITYRVLNPDYLRSMECHAFVSVPLQTVTHQSEHNSGAGIEAEESVLGTICLYYGAAADIQRAIAASGSKGGVGDKSRSREHEGAWLEFLGRLTAQELLRSREALQKRTLLKLNHLAGRYLVASSRAPEKARKGYLKALEGLINEVFHVDSLAIFYREDQACDTVNLLHATGIVMNGVTPELVPEARWGAIRYSLGESITGKCFEEGVAFPLPLGLPEIKSDGTQRKSYAVAIRSDGTWDKRNWSDPSLVIPIPLPASEIRQPGKGNALGVMRFASHRWNEFADMNRAFDPVEIETLEFLAQQIGPVLETMARNIEVEKAIQEQRHELRNSVRMINELIDEMTEDMHNAAPEATKTVKAYDLLDLKFSGLLARAQVQRLYRDETENRELNVAATDIHGQIIKRVCDIVGRRTAQEKHMRVNLMTSAKISQGAFQKMYVDPWYIEQAFLNILMNAVKYGNGGSMIDVDMAEFGDRTVISVRNQGVGIEEADREKIFESGYRSAKAAARAMGAGLGLPISRVIMRKHGGDVTLEKLSNPTIFQMIFPAALRHAHPETKPVAHV